MKTLIMIPARLGSTRLPNKIIADINGKTMIQRVYEQAIKVPESDVYIACSEEVVANAIKQFGARFLMTDPDLPSGTDRIYSAFTQINIDKELEFIVNLQGDVPNIDPKVIEQTVNVLKLKPECDIATAVIKLNDEKKALDPNVVKATADFASSNLAAECVNFTRTKPNASYYEHIGIYVYRKSALEKFVKLPQSPRELNEKLEQLRALENGMRIFACLIDESQKPINVDTIDSLEKARAAIK